LALMGEDVIREDAWGSFMYRTYALTTRPMDADVLDEKLAGALEQHFRRTESERDPPTFKAYPLASVYLSGVYGVAEGFKGQYRYLYIFGSVAFFVLLIAAVNYVNLATVLATQRAREVGMRKALGARYGQLVRQFLGESMLLSLAALAAALLLTAVALPAFNRLFEKNLVLGIGNVAFALALLGAFVVLVAMAAGAYPAFVLSRFRPTAVLRGAGMTATSSSGGLLRKGLVLCQFTISVVLIFGTAIIYTQLDYIQNKDLGFDGDQVVVVSLPGSFAEPGRESFKQLALGDAGVLRASVADGLPSTFGITISNVPGDISPEARTEREIVSLKPAVVDVDFIETLDIQIAAGRGFSHSFPADLTRGYVLNESAARALGWSPEEAVGKPFRFPARDDVPDGEVVGVVENFHIASLHNAIDPIVLQLRPDDNWSAPYVLVAKLAPDRIRGALDHLERAFARVAPDEAFEYEFLDDRFDAMYRTEQQL
ncbi:MAG: FtsX-like permease family protein, partial [Rhodothermales bacterium]